MDDPDAYAEDVKRRKEMNVRGLQAGTVTV